MPLKRFAIALLLLVPAYAFAGRQVWQEVFGDVYWIADVMTPPGGLERDMDAPQICPTITSSTKRSPSSAFRAANQGFHQHRRVHEGSGSSIRR
jgi:hypothetical protein